VAHLNSAAQVAERQGLGSSKQELKANKWFLPDLSQGLPSLGHSSSTQTLGSTGAIEVPGRVGDNPEQREKVVDPNDLRIARLERERKGAQFRQLMESQMVYDQTGDGLETDSERSENIREAVRGELKHIRMADLEPDPDATEGVVTVLCKHFPHLLTIFKHFCGHGAAGATNQLSFQESLHLLERAKLFPSHSSGATALRDAFLHIHFPQVQ
jgi:hypothetical protein